MENKDITKIFGGAGIGFLLGTSFGYMTGFESGMNKSFELVELLDVKVDSLNINFNETKMVDYILEVMEQTTLG